MKLGRGNKNFGGQSGLFPVHGPKIFVVQKGQFHGPKFFISCQLQDQKKRQKTGLSNTRCDALPDNLNGPGSHRCSHEKTNFLIKNFNPGILWDDFGIRHDIVVC